VSLTNAAGTSNALTFTYPRTSTTSATPGLTVSYAPGSDLVAGPSGTVLNGNASLSTLQAGDSGYETLPADSPLVGGQGYWAFFPNGGSQTIPPTGPQTLTVVLPAGQSIQIGNPGSTTATITGADEVFAYTPSGGYQSVTTLDPGAGALAYSAAGATVTIATH
jgi:hypothetical protein